MRVGRQVVSREQARMRAALLRRLHAQRTEPFPGRPAVLPLFIAMICRDWAKHTR